MDAEIKERLTSRDIWMRALYMLIFAIAYGVARIVMTLLVIFQFLTILFSGHANEPLLRFGNNLAVYVFQILQFQTFNSEEQPFPFAEWPDEDPGDNRWVNGGTSMGTDGSAEASSAEVADTGTDAPEADLGGGPTDPRIR